MKTKEEHVAIKQFIFGKTSVSDKPLNAKEAENLISKAEEIKKALSFPGQSEIIELFSKVSQAWADPAYPKRLEARDALHSATGLSAEFIDAVLDEFPYIISPERLLNKIGIELGNNIIQGRISPRIPQPEFRVIIQPAGLVLHVAAGNVFLGCVESLIDGIITRNINFVRMSSADRSFPLIFAESIKEFDAENAVTGRLAVIWWPAGASAIEDLFKKRMDRIVFWGGGTALSNWQKGIGQSTTLIAHGPKISFGVISKAGLESSSLQDLTDRISFDMAVWEQRACNSPQAIFVDSNVSQGSMRSFIDSLSRSLEKIKSDLPPARRTMDECVEVLRARELALARRIASGEPVEVLGPVSQDWTIIFEDNAKDTKIESSPLGRTIIIKRYQSLNGLSAAITEHSPYLQTAGYCLADSEIDEYAASLSGRGVTRICPFGVMAIPPAGSPHDGAYALRDLVRFAAVE